MSMRTPRDELYRDARLHYMELSDEACNFNSLILDALEKAQKYEKFIEDMRVSANGFKFCIDTVVTKRQYDSYRRKEDLAGRLWVRVEELIKILPDNWHRIIFSMITYTEAQE